MRHLHLHPWPAVLCVLILAVARPAVAEPVSVGAAIATLLASDRAVLRDAATAPDLDELRPFYVSRGNRPVWSGTPRSDAMAEGLLAALRAAPEHGLRTERYNLAAIDARRHHAGIREMAEADLLLSDAFLRHARDLRVGQRPIDGLDPPSLDARALLDDQLAAGRIGFDGLAPAGPEYQRLRDALRQHRDLAQRGGWPSLADGPSVKPGMSDDRVTVLRQRLLVTGELAAGGETAGPQLDETLVAALKAFQRRHGLADDGVLGRSTVAALNVSAQRRVGQIIINLERLRSLPRPLEASHLMVNAAAAHLTVVENDVPVLDMPVIVGDADHPTPSFRAHVTSVVTNPPWRVPRSIAVKEILPKLRRDPGYLASNNLTVLKAIAGDGEADDPSVAVADWSAYGPNNFPFRLRQEPGPDNALGALKFNVSGSRDIYLHDTPSRKLFEKPARTLSHGCVRLSRPLDLALHLLKAKGWNEERLREVVASGKTRTLPLGRKVPLYVVYITAWVDEDGTVQFRDDPYRRDVRLGESATRPSS